MKKPDINAAANGVVFVVLAAVLAWCGIAHLTLPPEAPPATTTDPTPPTDPPKPCKKLELENDTMPIYQAYGSPSPDCTGYYFESGTYNGQPYYTSGGWYLYFRGTDWCISDGLGFESYPPGWWATIGDPIDPTNIQNDYYPGAPNTGTVTIEEYVPPPTAEGTGSQHGQESHATGDSSVEVDAAAAVPGDSAAAEAAAGPVITAAGAFCGSESLALAGYWVTAAAAATGHEAMAIGAASVRVSGTAASHGSDSQFERGAAGRRLRAVGYSGQSARHTGRHVCRWYLVRFGELLQRRD